MAAVPDAACIEHVGLRLFLCPDRPVPDASRLLRHPAREQGDLPRCSDAASDSGLGRAANRRMLRLGSSATAIPRTSPITIAGARTARWARQFHAARQGPSIGKHAERSSRNLCLTGYTTFTALLHDKFLRATGHPRSAHSHRPSATINDSRKRRQPALGSR